MSASVAGPHKTGKAANRARTPHSECNRCLGSRYAGTMPLVHAPLLKIQRELLEIPRGMERFQVYLKTIANSSGDDVELLPLVAMNPMAREHVAEKLDELLAFAAEDVMVEAIRFAESKLGGEPKLHEDIRVGLVVLDDVRGGWTNRYLTESGFIFPGPIGKRQRPWITVPLWVSEPASVHRVRESALMSIYRFICAPARNGKITLRWLMEHEGKAAAFAGVSQLLEPEDVEYSREVIEPYLDATDFPTQFACLFGDEAARQTGHPPLGLSARAGLALALDQYSAGVASL